MKLIDLDARFLQYKTRAVPKDQFVDGILHPDGVEVTLHKVEALKDADGICFKCPACFNGDKHSVICWFVGKVSDDVKPSPGRWTPEGKGLEDLTFVPGNPARAVSVQLNSGCKWHGFVRNGDAT